MLDKKAIEELRAAATKARDYELRAMRLRDEAPTAEIFVGVTAVAISAAESSLANGTIRLRAVSHPPDVSHVIRSASADHGTDYLGVARHAQRLTGELALGVPVEDFEGWGKKVSLKLAHTIIVMLRILGHHDITAPVATGVSWDTVAGYCDGSLEFLLLDDVSEPSWATVPLEPIPPEDLAWVDSNLGRCLDLQNAETSRRFALAFYLLGRWNHVRDPRVAIANLWCALDALFGKQNDKPVTGKLLARIAAWIPGTNVDELRNLYALRCDAIHGRSLPQRTTHVGIGASVRCLRRALRLCVDREAAPLPDWEPRKAKGRKTGGAPD